MQPGQTITPNSAPQPPVEPQEPQSANPVDQSSQSFYQEQNETVPPSPTLSSGASEVASWTASEYIDHNKGMGWFVLLGLILFVGLGLLYFFTRDVFVSVLVALAGITFAVFAARPPRVLNYSIAHDGITIGGRKHFFSELKSFTMMDDGPIPSVLLLPMKRFMPPITIFYDPREEDMIISALANYLPHENKEPDFVDRIMSRIRF